MGKKKRQKEQINIYASNKKNKWKHRQSLCLQRFGAIFRWPLTSSEMSSLLGKFWLTAAREACSMSRIHLLMLSIDESHSRWPGALSLQTGEEKKGTRKTKMSNEERKRPEEEMLTLELLKHRHIAGFLSPPPFLYWLPRLIDAQVTSAKLWPVGSRLCIGRSSQAAKLALKPLICLWLRPHGQIKFVKHPFPCTVAHQK